jgi:hypothetical protein
MLANFCFSNIVNLNAVNLGRLLLAFTCNEMLQVQERRNESLSLTLSGFRDIRQA